MLRQEWRRYLRRGSQGEDVRHVQELLAQAGHDPGPIDGIFGRLTDAAVRAFQGAKRLIQDGVVGPITWNALTASTPPSGAKAKGRSLHIGLNVVDDAAYGTPIPPLKGCINDANSMRKVAESQGYRATTLLDTDGTSTNILNEIRSAAAELRSGDIFLLTYAGHGSQVPDTTGDEPDNLDETWVAYDRQIIDDELYSLWGQFKPGVRILLVSDSCHSGTVARVANLAYQAFAAAYIDDPELGFVLDSTPELATAASRDVVGWADLREAVHAVMPAVVAELHGASRTAVMSPDVDRLTELVLAQVRGDTRATVLPAPPRTRELPVEVARRDAAQRSDLYREIKQEAHRAPPPQSHVLLLAGAQDHQLALDGSRNGLFTQRLLEVWDNGNYNGVGYAEFHRRIVGLMPPQQIPNLFWATPVDPKFEAQHPFTI